MDRRAGVMRMSGAVSGEKSGGGSGIRDAALPLPALGDGGDVAAGRLLVSFAGAGGADPRSRRAALQALQRWARNAAAAVIVLPASAEERFGADLRSLGFEDAGPLPRHVAVLDPAAFSGRGPLAGAALGALIRTAGLLLPRRPDLEGVETGETPPEEDEILELRRGRAASLGAPFDSGGLASGSGRISGVSARRGGTLVGYARWEGSASETDEKTVRIPEWIAPADDEPAAVALAAAVASVARRRGAAAVAMETGHPRLRDALRLARFLPGRPTARVLVRRGRAGSEESVVPICSWHLVAPTRFGRAEDRRPMC